MLKNTCCQIIIFFFFLSCRWDANFHPLGYHAQTLAPQPPPSNTVPAMVTKSRSEQLKTTRESANAAYPASNAFQPILEQDRKGDIETQRKVTRHGVSIEAQFLRTIGAL